MKYNLKIKMHEDAEFEFLLDADQNPMVFNSSEEARKEANLIDLPFQIVEDDRNNSN